MGEVPRKIAPAIDFEQQIGDFYVGQQAANVDLNPFNDYFHFLKRPHLPVVGEA
jgi:hypothetical protein